MFGVQEAGAEFVAGLSGGQDVPGDDDQDAGDHDDDFLAAKHNPGVTEFAEIPGRGHSLILDHGWAEVSQTALDFIKRFT